MRKLRILFQLQQDTDGYPPFSVETLWATRVESDYLRIDNIPFYVKGVSKDDIVSASKRQDENYDYNRTIRKSGNSTFRAVFFDLKKASGFVAALELIGCDHEWHSSKNLVAINAESEKKAHALLEHLRSFAQRGALDYEEATLRY